MNRFCSECGSPLADTAKFCENCGAEVLPKTEIERNVSGLPEGIFLDENGAYHWIYKLNMLKNPVPLITLIKLFLFIFGMLGIFVAIGCIRYGDWDLALKQFLICFLGIGGGFCIVTVIVWMYLTVSNGGYRVIEHIMDESKVVYRESEQTVDSTRAAAAVTMLLEAADGSDSMNGLAGMSFPTQFDSYYNDVRSIKAVRKRDLIKVNNVLQRNTIYAAPHQYDFVYNYITSHCPNAKIK